MRFGRYTSTKGQLRKPSSNKGRGVQPARFLHGVFLSDIHLPDNIPLSGVFSYIKDLNPDIVILGGDIVDAANTHGCDSMKAEAIQLAWYYRDVKLLREFLTKLQKAAPNAEIIFLEGNHEQRWTRISNKYPGPFPPGTFDLVRDAAPKGMKIRWIPYGTYESYHKIGDMIFTHGNDYPTDHSKKYAMSYAPNKVLYGHLHDWQAFTIRTAMADNKACRYAMTAGCLTHRQPDYKKGAPNKWVNGFASFVTDGEVTVPTAHVIENGWFAVGAKVYGQSG